MKLNEIKTLTGDVDLKEGVIPVHITMTLEQVIAAGKITNSVQTFIMAGLIDMFKAGGPTRWPRELNAYNMSTMGTSSDMIKVVEDLSEGEQTNVAQWLLVKLQDVAGYESTPSGHTMDTLTWVRSVLTAQA